MALIFSRTISLLGFRPWGDLGGMTAYTTKRGRVVWFLKSPPRKRPSPAQLQARNSIKLAAQAWRGLTQQERLDWKHSLEMVGSPIIGYHAWVRYCRNRDQAPLNTMERHTGIKLVTTPASLP